MWLPTLRSTKLCSVSVAHPMGSKDCIYTRAPKMWATCVLVGVGYLGNFHFTFLSAMEQLKIIYVI